MKEKTKQKIAENIDIIVCDDIRHEMGGKLSFMGVYRRDIVFQSLPGFMSQIAIAVLLDNIKKPFVRIEAKLKAPNEEEMILKAKAEGLRTGANHNLILNYAPFQVSETGVASLKIFLDDSNTPDIKYKFDIKIKQD